MFCVNSVRFLRDLKDFFDITMKIRPVEDASKPKQITADGESNETRSDAYIISCVGIGYSNIAKKT